MSRMHPSQNKSELYDAYLNTMLKNGKRIEKPLRNDTGRLSRDNKNMNSNNNGQLVVSRPTVKFGSKNEEQLRSKPSNDELVRKEVFNNNMATVEVTVRTVGPKGSSADKCLSDDRREPWGKLLMNRRSDENIQGSFENFDPLRTLHFLSKELQMKLQSICPSDANIQQIVNDMENAIHRLPPDVLSQIKPNMLYDGDVGAEIPISIKKSTNHVAKNEAQTQTVIVGDGETKKMQMQLEDSANKLEASCKEMEDLCKKLRIERDELESMLQVERKTVVSLRQELNEVITDKDTKTMRELNKIISERDLLTVQIEDLQNQLESKVNQPTEEMRNLVEDLKEKQLVTEQETTLVRTELTLLKLEKDKLNVLLECRDKQLKELRKELETIQQLVNAQLQESRAKPTFSTTSTISSVSGIWNVPSRRPQNYSKSIHELFMNNDVMRRVLMDKDIKLCDSYATATTVMDDATKTSNSKVKDIQVIPQKEMQTPSQLTLSDIEMSSENFIRSSQPSIQDMFAEIKRQAFMKIATPLPSKSQIVKNKSSSNVNINTSTLESSQDSESS